MGTSAIAIILLAGLIPIVYFVLIVLIAYLYYDVFSSITDIKHAQEIMTFLKTIDSHGMNVLTASQRKCPDEYINYLYSRHLYPSEIFQYAVCF